MIESDVSNIAIKNTPLLKYSSPKSFSSFVALEYASNTSLLKVG